MSQCGMEVNMKLDDEAPVKSIIDKQAQDYHLLLGTDMRLFYLFLLVLFSLISNRDN